MLQGPADSNSRPRDGVVELGTNCYDHLHSGLGMLICIPCVII